jgi:hypothetical protein
MIFFALAQRNGVISQASVEALRVAYAFNDPQTDIYYAGASCVAVI